MYHSSACDPAWFLPHLIPPAVQLRDLFFSLSFFPGPYSILVRNRAASGLSVLHFHVKTSPGSGCKEPNLEWQSSARNSWSTKEAWLSSSSQSPAAPLTQSTSIQQTDRRILPRALMQQLRILEWRIILKSHQNIYLLCTEVRVFAPWSPPKYNFIVIPLFSFLLHQLLFLLLKAGQNQENVKGFFSLSSSCWRLVCDSK